ncbi:MAG: hypothetical protein K0Q74_165 [Gammaproteobacteria bacterium]|nr:hypothetical protein [Gammaproteobacteria bacterium]
MLKKYLRIIVLISIAAALYFIFGGTSSAPTASAGVNKSSCGSLANTKLPFILVLDSGDSLIESINQCAKDAKLVGASISGLGQLQNPILADAHRPTQTKFDGYYELASLNGNIASHEGNYYTHLHAVLGDDSFRSIAGHVNAATVGLTVEVTITPLTGSLNRAINPETGFGLIVH